jgi:hypothetical protein
MIIQPQKLKEIWVKIKKHFKMTQFDCVFCYVKNLFKKRPDIKFDKKTLIIISSIVLIIVGLGIGVYSQAKFSYLTEKIFDPLANTSFIASVSDSIYKAVWEKDFEMEKLKQEVEMSKIKEERANKIAQEEATKRDEAETAQKEAEEEAQQEAVRRSQAEARAKQEEFEKELKEQQLSEKEAEEKKMNADNDNDGLSYRRELELGSSDWDVDSDGDGVRDGEDAHPAGGGRYIAQNFQWEYDGTIWTWNYSIQEDWYEYYKNKPRSAQGVGYITENDPFIKEIAGALKNTASKEGYHLSSFIVSFVQGLPYVEDYYTTFDEYPKYPIETFVERNGDCEDTSYLFASLVQATGLGTALVEFHNHMGVGIKTVHSQSGYYYPIGSDWYYYYETTGEGWEIGELPDDYLYEQAKIIRVWDGDISYSNPQYIKPCEYSSDFSAYFDGVNFYTDSQCNNRVYCLAFQGYYIKPPETNYYWDSSCSQLVVKGCYKSSDYSGYFEDAYGYYYDSRCSQEAKICRPSTIYSDRYWDGDYNYWDSNCTQKVVSWCTKSTIEVGYFFSSIDYKYYYDYQCTQEADVY